MHHLLATLHTLGLQAHDRLRARVDARSENGNVTLEQVLWAVAVIAIVAAVVAVIRGFVMNEAAKIG
jgi:hypothetical protein